jgi:hypothetical protein
VLFRHVAAGFDSMPSPEGSKPDHFDKNPASQPGGRRDVPPPAPGAGERQENQESKLILPSYLSNRARENLMRRFTHQTKESLEGTGWDSYAEYVFDRANILPKPNTPNIPKDDLDALDEENALKHLTAKDWEERSIDFLIEDEDIHLIPDFKREMQEYRESVKSIVQLWREKGIL